MNSLLFLVYVTAMGVYVILERQAKRQKSETALECARLGLHLPPARPKIQALEALLNITIGFVMIFPAGFGFWLIFREPFIRAHTEPVIVNFYSVLLSTGLTLVYLGGRALRQNMIYRRNVTMRAHGGREAGADGTAG
jgi:hypothetical protein